MEGVVTPTFSDVPVNHKFFKAVEEAATDHAYEVMDGKEYIIIN